MPRQFLATINAFSMLAVVLCAVGAQEPTPKKVALPKSNQVYVKIIFAGDRAIRDKGEPVVESWIADQLKKGGQSKVTAATRWVPLGEKRDEFEEPVLVWEGGCRVHAQIVERKDGRIKVFLDGWFPFSYGVTVSLMDEPGSREIAVAEQIKTVQGQPYVAVLIAPPLEERAAPADHKE